MSGPADFRGRRPAGPPRRLDEGRSGDARWDDRPRDDRGWGDRGWENQGRDDRGRDDRPRDDRGRDDRPRDDRGRDADRRDDRPGQDARPGDPSRDPTGEDGWLARRGQEGPVRRRPSVLGADLGAALDPRPAPRAALPDAHGFPEPLYLDNHLVVVVKPAGVLSQADRTGDADLLTRAKDYLRARFDRPGDVFVGLVHRLDRPVSGVMVLARTSKAAARLSEQFRERAVSKRYVALVEGTLTGQGRRADWLLKTDEAVAIVPPGTRGAREATLAWEAVGGAGGQGPGARTLVAVTLETGRSHQIRVQLSAMGHPVVGDARHGARTPWRPGEIALHALGLAIEHPTQRVPLVFAAPPDGWPAAYAAPLAALVEQEASRPRPGPKAPSPDGSPPDAAPPVLPSPDGSPPDAAPPVLPSPDGSAPDAPPPDAAPPNEAADSA